MGFFNLDEYRVAPANPNLKGISLKTIQTQGCGICPLNEKKGIQSQSMDARGTKKPFIYMLGEQPSRVDDQRGEHFAGKVGQLLRNHIPKAWLPDMRWNYVVRTHDAKSEKPKDFDDKGGKKKFKYEGPPTIAVEACRPSVIKDIEETKPFAIFGFGLGPLKWATDEGHINYWAGRYLPVKIGKHTCWFFPMLDPKIVLESRRYDPRPGEYGSDDEHWFAMMMRDALRIVETLPEPYVDTAEDALSGVKFVTGHKDGDLDKVLDYLDRCYNADEFGFDYETNILRPFNDGLILTVGLSLGDEDAFAFPLDHPKAGWSKHDKRVLEAEFEVFLRKAKGRRLVHRVMFDAEWTAFNFGRDTVTKPQWECSEGQAYIIDERTWTHSLDFQCMLHFGLRMKEVSNVDRSNMLAVDFETCLRYNAIDAKYHRRLYRRQHRILKEIGLQGVYEEHMKRTIATTLTALQGVPVNQDIVSKFEKKLTAEIKEIELDLFDLNAVRNWQRKTGQKFNPAQAEHVKDILQGLGFKLDFTKDEELQKIKHPFAKLIREWRAPSKLLSTYIIAVKEGSPNVFIDGMMHPIINVTKTRTWRTASEDPNIQNWPKRGEKVYIRQLVKPWGGTELIVAAVDYGGMQARNVAMESLDEKLIEIYWTGYDIHKDWLQVLQKLLPKWEPVQELGSIKDDKDRQKQYRNVVKNKFVFPAFFGAHETSLARYLGVEIKIAANMREQFMDRFPGVAKWHENRRQFYRKHGYITGATGFRRRAPIALNQLINAPIQADETFIVCNAWHRLSVMEDPQFTPNLMVHDDLTWIWEKRNLERNVEVVATEMVKWSAPWQRSVPLEIEIDIGTDWENVKHWRKFETSKSNGVKETTK